MSLDFQQVQEQIRDMGEKAFHRKVDLENRRAQALALLEKHAGDLEFLRQKVARVVANYDASLRCALPLDAALADPQPLNAHYPCPGLPDQATILAADGSQIALDRHAQVEYGLINVGAIQLRLGSPGIPVPLVHSQLLYDEMLYTKSGLITDAILALRRDRAERVMLAEIAETVPSPVLTFTDGPMELWGGRDSAGDSHEFKESLEDVLKALRRLEACSAVAAGYVDRPASDLVVRLLEVAMIAELNLPEIGGYRPLRGVRDIHLFQEFLRPGERSAVFALQSPTMRQYLGVLAIHFFFLNVGRDNKPSLARVEIPAWVAANPEGLANLQAVLVDQCRIMGARPYPYILHRAHETAVVTMEERDQVTQMILLELRRQGLSVEDVSQKQAAKATSR